MNRPSTLKIGLLREPLAGFLTGKPPSLPEFLAPAPPGVWRILRQITEPVIVD